MSRLKGKLFCEVLPGVVKISRENRIRGVLPWQSLTKPRRSIRSPLVSAVTSRLPSKYPVNLFTKQADSLRKREDSFRALLKISEIT